jgi:WD40 repeat protein
MAAASRTVRVFISSTFRDMHAERDHLVTVVFPELRERFEKLGLEFYDVDLRWGVPAKDANGETANSWEYCRQWIDRVEPFFVCILGQRYGYRPEPRELRDAAEQAQQQTQRRSITELEVRYAFLNDRRKRRSYFYLRETLVPVPPDAATAEDRSAYDEFVDPPEQLAQLDALKADIRGCGRPVRDYGCRWTGSGFTELEQFGRLVLDDLWSGVLCDERYVSKEVWRQVLGTDPDTDPRYTDESQPVPDGLWEKIVALARPAPVSPLDAERQQMEAFAASRLRWFQGRTAELQQLTDFLDATVADAPRLAVVAAVPGQGKSALLAKLSTLIPQLPTLDSQLSAFLITHFVGATERSASARALVERLLDELDRSGITWPAEQAEAGQEPKRDFNSLCLRLAKCLGDYAGERRIAILLDALNQLSDGHDLRWLPSRLGPSVRVIVSCVEDAAAVAEGTVPIFVAGGHKNGTVPLASPESPEQRVLRSLASRQPAPLRVPLGPLTEADVRTIVVEYLKEYCKELDREHVDALCAIPQVRNPLYLLVMLNELRTLGGNDLNRIVPGLIASMPQDHPDTVSLFRWVLQRLEVFGPEAVCWWCLYLAHGRVGMASQELVDLLARKLGPDAAAAALRIERGLRRYLQRRGSQLDFFHGQLRQAVLEQYGPQAEAVAVHCEMADYFTACAKGTDPEKEWETGHVRGFAQCVYHLVKAWQYDLAVGLLSNFVFLLHKTRAGLLQGVFEDYDMVRREAPTGMARRLEILDDFFREKAHILRRGSDEWPTHKILLQLAVEHADDSPLTIGAEQWLAENRCDWLWLRRVPRLPHAQRNPCLAVLEGHTHAVNGAEVLADGRLVSWSWDGTLRLWDGQSGACLMVLEGHTRGVKGVQALSDGRLLSWSNDGTLRLWDGQSGACLAVLEGHTFQVEGVQVLADGRLLSWSNDKTPRLWDGQTGACLAVLRGHTGWVVGVQALSDGRLLSWSRDGTLRLWDGQSERCLAFLEGHTDRVLGFQALADGRLLSWSWDKTLRLWDGQTGACLAVLQGHSDSVLGVRVLADGRLLSLSGDGTPRLWDGQSGACLAVLEGHRVSGVQALSDGRLLSWSDDGTLQLWDGRSGACLVVLEGHDWLVRGVQELSDGRLLSWSNDKSLRLWDGQSGACLAVLEGHSDRVRGVQALSDGRLLSWSLDKTLRLWDGQSGACLAVLEGHNDVVYGVQVLSDGRVLSWSDGGTLRLWDGQSGACLVVLEGHSGLVWGVQALSDGRLLSWSDDGTLRLWDGQSGACLEVVPQEQVAGRNPEWRHVIAKIENPPSVSEDFFGRALLRSAILRHRTLTPILAVWNAESDTSDPRLLPDGTAVVGQANGQVCVLKLHHGQRRISLAEAESLLPQLYPPELSNAEPANM